MQILMHENPNPWLGEWKQEVNPALNCSCRGPSYLLSLAQNSRLDKFGYRTLSLATTYTLLKFVIVARDGLAAIPGAELCFSLCLNGSIVFKIIGFRSIVYSLRAMRDWRRCGLNRFLPTLNLSIPAAGSADDVSPPRNVLR